LQNFTHDILEHLKKASHERFFIYNPGLRNYVYMFKKFSDEKDVELAVSVGKNVALASHIRVIDLEKAVDKVKILTDRQLSALY
jgi:hypothetical protein